MTNGCFDILHAGHVTDLEQARKLVVTANGGRVVVLDFLAGVSTAGMIERMGEGRTDR